jgi:hypothetical protein
MRIALLATAVLATLAPAGAAQPRPEVTVALATCLAEAQPMADRAAALVAAGWTPLAPTDRAGAAQALAPFRMVLMTRAFTPTGPALSPAQAQAEMVLSRDVLVAQAALDSPRNLWFTLPEGEGHLRLFDPIGADWARCDLVARVALVDLEDVLGPPVESRDFGRMVVDVFHLAGGGASRLERIRFAPGTFADYEAGTALVMPLRRAP